MVTGTGIETIRSRTCKRSSISGCKNLSTHLVVYTNDQTLTSLTVTVVCRSCAFGLRILHNKNGKPIFIKDGTDFPTRQELMSLWDSVEWKEHRVELVLKS